MKVTRVYPWGNLSTLAVTKDKNYLIYLYTSVSNVLTDAFIYKWILKIVQSDTVCLGKFASFGILTL